MNATIRQLLDTANMLLKETAGATPVEPVMAVPAPPTMPTVTPASRYRGASFALRAALEGALAEHLTAHSTPLAIHEGSQRVAFLWLRICTDADTARRARVVWSQLCLGCHYHQYEIGPTKDQVGAWRTEATAVISLLSC